MSGLRDTLVSSLKGGAGLGTLGHINITNRNNVTSNVDLSAAETLGEIVAAINTQAAGVTASINSARNGIQLTDTTGATASNLIVADGDANNSATALGIVANSAAIKVNSGALASAADQRGHVAVVAQRRSRHRRRRFQDHRHQRRDSARST